MHDERVARSTADGITDVEHVAAVGLATISDEEMRRRLVEAPSHTVALLRLPPPRRGPARRPRASAPRPMRSAILEHDPGVQSRIGRYEIHPACGFPGA